MGDKVSAAFFIVVAVFNLSDDQTHRAEAPHSKEAHKQSIGTEVESRCLGII